MRIVDTKGQLCPAPIIATKRALKETVAGESFIVLTDNITSLNNLIRFLKDNYTDFKVSEKEGVWTITVTRTSGEVSQKKAEEYCSQSVSHFEKGDFIVVIASDKMGEGDEDLGQLLLINFIKALKDIDKLPEKILFYNSGVKLAAKDSPVIDHLRDMQKMEVEILLCATCVNYFKIEISAGTLSNMYSIAEVMTKAVRIIKP